MSEQRTNVVGIVFVTMCLTAAVMVGGWFAARTYLGQPAENTPVEETAPPPAKRRTPSRTAAAHASRTANRVTPAAAGADEQSTTPSAQPADDESDEPQESAHTPAAPAEAVAAPAGDTPDDARGIVAEAQRRTESRSYQYVGLLQAFAANGKVTEKQWTFDRAGSHGQSKAVLRFSAPAEVKGVALLIENHTDRASDQWMWTPAIERDRRIALQDRSTRFFGTDFSFEDLEERDVDQYDYVLVGDDTIGDAVCWKIELTPKRTRTSQYTRSVAWIRKDNYAYVRVDNFVKNELVKRLTLSSLENVQGIWTAKLLDMADLRRSTHTRLALLAVKYNVPVKSEDFTLQAIRRIGD
jgi:outer membrane lipoprotein-sorting protein